MHQAHNLGLVGRMPIKNGSRVSQALEETKDNAARLDKLDERMRATEQKVAQVWILGTVLAIIVVPLISYVIHKVL